MAGLLRLCTAGSVDDGKSTLIGRLWVDSRAVYDDQVRAVTAASKQRTAGPLDYSLFTDGLKAEREQGITIDVAHRYFATPRRKFILADTPGHEQYTRNMVTGASTADVAILLVDARHGVTPQTERHARIARLLGLRHLVLAVNKMDLVGFDESAFTRICEACHEWMSGTDAYAIPISALYGDNVISHSPRTPWFDGQSLLEYLEAVDVDHDVTAKPFRFPVQLILRPDDQFRGYAGQIVSGTIRVGDPIVVWPAGRVSTVHRVVTRDGDLDVAHAPMSVTLVLEDALDISRGDLLAGAQAFRANAQPVTGTMFDAEMVWMDERPLDPSRVYLLKHTTRTVTAEVDHALLLNQIGSVTLSTARPIVFDRYADNRTTGSFILIDPSTNFTAGAGMIADTVRDAATRSAKPSAAERLARLARTAPSDAEAIEAVRRVLEDLLT